MPKTLNDKAVETHVQAVRDALGERSMAGLFASPNLNKIEQLLAPMNQADRQALEAAFNKPPGNRGGDLRTQLRQAFGEADGTRLTTILDREDGRSNDAGAVRTALAQAASDPQKAGAELTQVLRQLNSQQVEQLRSDYRHQTGHDFVDDIKNNASLSKPLRDNVERLIKGSDRRTSQDVVDIARAAAQGKDRDLLTNIIAGDSPQATAARQQLAGDQDFRRQVAQAFPNHEIGPRTMRGALAQNNFDVATDKPLVDYLHTGHVGLDTIARQDTSPWLFSNKENLDLALRNATPTERSNYRSGKDMDETHREPANAQEKEALQFYRNLHGTLAGNGTPRETAVREDQLLNGRKTIVSEMAGQHSDGFLGTGIAAGHKTNDLLTAAEHLSREDWQTLHDPATSQKLTDQIRASLGTYATPAETERVMQILSDKGKANTYEESTRVERSFEQVLNDNRSQGLLGGTTYEAGPVLDKINHLSPADAAKYRDDKQFRGQVDALVRDGLNPAQQTYARAMLEQAASTGKPPREGPAERVLGNNMRNVSGERSVNDVEALLADPAVRQRLNRADAELSPADQSLKRAIENAVFASVCEKMPVNGESIAAQQKMTDQQMQELMANGHLSPSTKLQWGYDRANLYSQVATAAPAERQASERYLSDGEKQLVDALAKQNGQPQLEDRLRSFVLRKDSDYQSFQNELRGLSNDQKEALKNAYEAKYHSPLNQDFLQRVSAQDQLNYRQYLTPSDSDGRQDSYDNYRHFLDARTGTALDGTALTAERASELQTSALQTYQSQYEKLNPQQQEAMNQFFGQALKDNKDSKEKYAEILTDASITAAALAAAPFTAGLSTAALAGVIGTAAVAGAGYRVGVFHQIEGRDFDGSVQNITKQALIGGTTAALSLIGPEIFAASGRFTGTAASAMARDLAAAPSAVALRQGSERILQRELTGLASSRGFGALSEAECAALTNKLTADGIKAAQREALQKSVQECANQRLAEAGEGLSRDLAARSTLGRQVVDNATIGGAGNAASEIIVAPLNENGVDWEKLGQGALTGAAMGAVMPLAFRVLGHAAGVVSARVTREADGVYIDPKTITEEISLRNTHTGQVETIRPGQGEKFKLTNEWQYENGGRFTPDVTPNPATPSERMTPQELRDVSTSIASRLGDRSVTPQQFREIFEGEYTINGVKRTLTPDERKMAQEVMEQAMPNMTSRAIDERMVALKDQLAADPNWSWQRRTDPFGRPYDGVNVLVLDGTTDGNALSHLFHKNSGVTPTVKVLQGADLERMQMGLNEINKLERTNSALSTKYADDLDRVLNPREGKTVRQIIDQNAESIHNTRQKYDLDNAIVFDDIRNATPAQREVLAGMNHLAVADLNGFNRSPNIYDFSSMGMGAGAGVMRDRVGSIIERAETLQRNGGLTTQEAVRQAIDANYSGTVRDTLPNAHLVETAPTRTNRDTRHEVAASGENTERYREQSLYDEITRPIATPEQIQNFLGRLSADQQRLGARVLQDGLVVNNYGTMIDQARQLHESILDMVPGRDPHKILIVTGLEENGSAYLTNSLYARANGLTADNFVSVQDLRNLAAKKPGEKLTPYQEHLKAELGDRRLVYLDD
ncbi:MAG: hypothetical protein KGS72_28835, partial [Cyanobacteria bacterium REEB67]|nr:hypothetical protein [Cyanobacteria bacterium REEB67]